MTPLMRRFAVLMLALCCLSMNAQAQSSTAVSLKDAPTIRVTRSRAGARFTQIALQSSGFGASNVTASYLLKYAYGTKSYALVGAPDWLATVTFDVQVAEPQADPALLSPREIQEHRRLLVRTVLANAFRLKFHTVHTIVAGYSLVADNTGARLTEHDSLTWSAGRITNSDGHLDMTALPISSLADELSETMGVPVVDRTGLKGTYDVSLWWDRNRTAGDAAGGYSGLASALREELGLKLVPEQQDIEQFVLDNIVPADN